MTRKKTTQEISYEDRSTRTCSLPELKTEDFQRPCWYVFLADTGPAFASSKSLISKTALKTMEQNQRLYYSAFTDGFKQISICYIVTFSPNARKYGPENL